jgi:CRP/FNR family transcriptional regulator, cyclic AMP receptor protein
MWKKKESEIAAPGTFGRAFSNSSMPGSGFGDSSSFSSSTSGMFAPSEQARRAIQSTEASPELQRLVNALERSQEFDALRLILKPEQWVVLGQHLQPFTVQTTQMVISQGATEMTVYLVESGTLGVHHEDAQGRIQIATVGSGSVVGEGSFFSRTPRNASVQAMSVAKLWALSPMRYAELAHKHPMIALSLVTAFGSVVTRRMSNKPKRAAVT